MTTVSVIIPTHDRPKYLIRAAESVAEQTRLPNELIIVNDGSTRDYSSAKNTIEDLPIDTYYYKTEGYGAASARNYGATHASGDILMFLDDDDRWRPTKIEQQLKQFTDDVGLVYSGRIAVSSGGSELYPIDGGAEGNLSKQILLSNTIGTTSGPAIQAEVFKKVGGFDEDMPGLQDWELWIRICQETNVAYSPQRTVEWTIHKSPDGQMTRQTDRYVNAIQLLRQKHADLFNSLSWKEQRQARAAQHKSLAVKYANVGSWKRFGYVLKSLYQWPSIAAAARLLPASILTKLRSQL